MTVLVDQSSKRFHGTGSAGPLTWTWRFLANTDIRVYRIADPDEEDPSTEVRVLLSDDDYLLTGAGSYTGGNMMLAAPLVEGEDLLVERSTEALQKVSIRNQGNNFRPAVHEDVFDRLSMAVIDRERATNTNTEDIGGIKVRMATAESTIVEYASRFDADEADIADHEARVSSLETTATNHGGRLVVVESGMVVLGDRLTTAEANIALLGAGLPGFEAYMRDATAADVVVNVVAANDPAAKAIIVGKTDDSAHVVTIQPAAGTIGSIASWDLDGQGATGMFIPDATTNNYLKVV